MSLMLVPAASPFVEKERGGLQKGSACLLGPFLHVFAVLQQPVGCDGENLADFRPVMVMRRDRSNIISILR